MQEGLPSAVFLGTDAGSEREAPIAGTEAARQRASFPKPPRPASQWPVGSALEMRCG